MNIKYALQQLENEDIKYLKCVCVYEHEHTRTHTKCKIRDNLINPKRRLIQW